MKSNNVFISSVHIFLVLFVFAFGLFFTLLYFADSYRFFLYELFLEKHLLFFRAGIILIGISFLLMCGFYFYHRHKFLKFEINQNSFSVDTTLIEKYVHEFLIEKKCFKDDFYCEVNIIKDNKIEITSFCSSIDMNTIKDLSKKIEKDIAKLLLNYFGYHKKIIFTIAYK